MAFGSGSNNNNSNNNSGGGGVSGSKSGGGSSTTHHTHNTSSHHNHHHLGNSGGGGGTTATAAASLHLHHHHHHQSTQQQQQPQQHLQHHPHHHHGHHPHHQSPLPPPLPPTSSSSSLSKHHATKTYYPNDVVVVGGGSSQGNSQQQMTRGHATASSSSSSLFQQNNHGFFQGKVGAGTATKQQQDRYYGSGVSQTQQFVLNSHHGGDFRGGAGDAAGGAEASSWMAAATSSGGGSHGNSTSISGGGGQQQQQQSYNHHHQQQQQHSRDLTSAERVLLDQIRSRKAELLKEIAQLQDEIDTVSRELIVTEATPQPSSTTTAHPPPDLLNTQFSSSSTHPPVHSSLHGNHVVVVPPPLADIELDNLSEHSVDGNGERISNNNNNKIPSNTVLGSNSSSTTTTTSGSSKDKDRLKLMSLGCKKFNMDPKKGIEFLVENGLLRKEDEVDTASFLYKGEGLNKTAIGDYLGERSVFNERVLKAFVELHDFSDLILVQALRQFLWSFRLPGEAQKIDRMMECFAQRYCQNNRDIFTNTDTCYVLSFAIIMLNTSLHNPSVKDKPTVDQFISMNRGINNGGDLPRELLVSLYNSIQSEPFKIPEDDGNDLMHTFFNPDKEGWLWKQGGRYKTWKRRWFILNDNCLYYFEFTQDKEPRGIIPLENVGVREIEDTAASKAKGRYCFELHATDGSEVIKACKTDSDGRVVEGKHSVYRMSAGSADERDEWVKALRQSISYSPFYEILKKSGVGTTEGGGGGTSASAAGSGGGGGGGGLSRPGIGLPGRLN